MKKFKKIVAVDPVSIIDSGREELKNYADEVIFHSDYPKDDTEIIDRINITIQYNLKHLLPKM